MSRRKHRLIEPTQFEAAYERAVRLAHRLAATLVGEELPAGEVQSRGAQALAMGMVLFLLRLGPEDIGTLFSGEGSLADLTFNPSSDYSGFEGIFADLWDPLADA